MTAKEYLKQAYRLNELIDSNISELEQLKILSVSVSAVDTSKEKIKGEPLASDEIGNIIAKMDELELIIQAEIDTYVDLKANIRKKIMKLQNENERLILLYRYIHFLTWEQLASKMKFSPQWVHVLHKRALKSFEKFMPIDCN